MNVRINRLFHGYASVRDYQVKEALKNREDLVIHLGDESMRVPYSELMGGQMSQIAFTSIHEKGLKYYLIDYAWFPDKKQQKLL